MPMTKTHDAVYAGEKYTNRDGEEKTRYLNIGSLFQREDGSLSLKLENIPIGFSGWVNFYVPKPKEQTATRKTARDDDPPHGDDEIPPPF